MTEEQEVEIEIADEDNTLLAPKDDEDNTLLVTNDGDRDEDKTNINIRFEKLKGIFNRKLLWVIVALLITGITITVLLSAILPTTNSIQDCSSVNIPLHAEVTCNTNTSYTIGSTCTFHCYHGYNMKGVASTTCNASLQWSNKPPICQKCPPCFVGEKCTESIRWTDLEIELNGDPLNPSTVNYAGHPIQCTVHPYLHHITKLYWRGNCIDQKTSQSFNCQGYESPLGSEKSALATLIRFMVEAKVYPDVCDPSDMAGVICKSKH